MTRLQSTVFSASFSLSEIWSEKFELKLQLSFQFSDDKRCRTSENARHLLLSSIGQRSSGSDQNNDDKNAEDNRGIGSSEDGGHSDSDC